MLLFYKHFNYESEPTLNQQMPVLNQRQRVEFFPWQAVNQLNQLNQHYFCLLSEKNRDWPRER